MGQQVSGLQVVQAHLENLSKIQNLGIPTQEAWERDLGFSFYQAHLEILMQEASKPLFKSNRCFSDHSLRMGKQKAPVGQGLALSLLTDGLRVSVTL